jgi:hypothetical protein
MHSAVYRDEAGSIPVCRAKEFYCGVDWSLAPAWSHKPNHVSSNLTSATSSYLMNSQVAARCMVHGRTYNPHNPRIRVLTRFESQHGHQLWIVSFAGEALDS